MKTLFILFLIPTLSFSQSWAPIGSKWTYSQPTLVPDLLSYTTFESIKDTIIDGQNCKQITEILRHSPITADTSLHYMYSDSNKVYFRKSNTWNLLYDFNLQKNDSFIVGDYGQQVKILSVDTISINGVPKRRFEYYAPSLSTEFSGIVIEGIGHTIDMFPTYDNQLFGPLRCYSDTTLGLFRSPYHYGSLWTTDCDKFITKVDDISDFTNSNVFPNPFSEQLHFNAQSKDEIEITLYDVFSRQIFKNSFLNSTNVNTTEFATGIYFYELSINDKIIRKGKIVKHDAHAFK